MTTAMLAQMPLPNKSSIQVANFAGFLSFESPTMTSPALFRNPPAEMKKEKTARPPSEQSPTLTAIIIRELLPESQLEAQIECSIYLTREEINQIPELRQKYASYHAKTYLAIRPPEIALYENHAAQKPTLQPVFYNRNSGKESYAIPYLSNGKDNAGHPPRESQYAKDLASLELLIRPRLHYAVPPEKPSLFQSIYAETQSYLSSFKIIHETCNYNYELPDTMYISNKAESQSVKHSSSHLYRSPATLTALNHQDVLFHPSSFPESSDLATKENYPQKSEILFLPEYSSAFEKISMLQRNRIPEIKTPEIAIKNHYSFRNGTSNTLMFNSALLPNILFTSTSRLSMHPPVTSENTKQGNYHSFSFANAENIEIKAYTISGTSDLPTRTRNSKYNFFPETNGSPSKPEKFFANMLQTLSEITYASKSAEQQNSFLWNETENRLVLPNYNYYAFQQVILSADFNTTPGLQDVTRISGQDYSPDSCFLPSINLKPEVNPPQPHREHTSNLQDMPRPPTMHAAKPVTAEMIKSHYQKPEIETDFEPTHFNPFQTVKYYERAVAHAPERNILQGLRSVPTNSSPENVPPQWVRLQQNFRIDNPFTAETEYEPSPEPELNPKPVVLQERRAAAEIPPSSYILSKPFHINEVLAIRSFPGKKAEKTKPPEMLLPASYGTAITSPPYTSNRKKTENAGPLSLTIYPSENTAMIKSLSALAYYLVHSPPSRERTASKSERNAPLPHTQQFITRTAVPLKFYPAPDFPPSLETLLLSELPHISPDTNNAPATWQIKHQTPSQVLFFAAYETIPAFSSNKRNNSENRLKQRDAYHRTNYRLTQPYQTSSVTSNHKITTPIRFSYSYKDLETFRRKNIQSIELQTKNPQFNLQEPHPLKKDAIQYTGHEPRRTEYLLLSIPTFMPFTYPVFIGQYSAEGNLISEKEEQGHSSKSSIEDTGREQLIYTFPFQQANRNLISERTDRAYKPASPPAKTSNFPQIAQADFNTEIASPYFSTPERTNPPARQTGSPEIRTLHSSEKITKAEPIPFNSISPFYHSPASPLIFKNGSSERNIYLCKSSKPLPSHYTPMQSHTPPGKIVELIQNKPSARNKYDDSQISALHIPEEKNRLEEIIFAGPPSYSEEKSFQHHDLEQALDIISGGSRKRAEGHSTAKLRTYNLHRNKRSYLPQKISLKENISGNNQQDYKEETLPEYSETGSDGGIEQKINDDSTSENTPDKAGFFSALGTLLLGGVMSAASALGRAKNAYSKESKYSDLTEEHKTETPYTTYNEHPPKTAGHTAEISEVSEEYGLETVLEETLKNKETEEKRSELKDGFYSVLGRQKVEPRHISEEKIRITAHDSETGQHTDYELEGNSWYAAINSILEEAGLTPQYEIMTYTDIETGKKKRGLYISRIDDIHAEALDALGRENERLAGIIGLINGEEPESGRRSLEEVLLTDGDIIEIAYIIHGLYSANYGTDSDHDKEEELSLHYISKGDEVIPGFAALIDDYLLDNADIMQEGDEYKIEAIPAETSDNSVLSIHPNSWYAVTDRILKKAGLTPRYRMMEYTDLDTGLAEKGLYLEGIEELDSAAEEMLGAEKKDFMGILGFVNGEEPGGGTVPLTEVILKPGDRVSLAYIVQGFYDGSFGSGISGHEAEDYNMAEHDFLQNENAANSF